MRFLACRKADSARGPATHRPFRRNLAHIGRRSANPRDRRAELIGVGVDVDQGLAGMVGRDQGISDRSSPRRALGADDQQQIRPPRDPLLQLRVGAVAELAGIDGTIV